MKTPKDYGHRLQCPGCSGFTIDPTRSLLHCGGTCASRFDRTMPKCFTSYFSNAFLLAVAKGEKTAGNVEKALREIRPPGRCCGLPPKVG